MSETLYLIVAPGGVEGIFKKEAIEELMRKYYSRESLRFINIVPYEVGVLYDGNVIPEMVDHYEMWDTLNSKE